MPYGMLVVVGWMGFVALVGFVLLGWGLYTGQFDDLDESALRMLRDREPQEWPGRSTSPKEV